MARQSELYLQTT